MFKSVDETYLELKSQLESSISERLLENKIIPINEEVKYIESNGETEVVAALEAVGAVIVLSGLLVTAVATATVLLSEQKAALKWYAKENNIPSLSELESKTASMDKKGEEGKELKNPIAKAFNNRQIVKKIYNGKQFLAYTKITTRLSDPRADEKSAMYTNGFDKTEISVVLTDRLAKKYSDFYLASVYLAEGVTTDKNAEFMKKILKMHKESKGK